MKGRGVRVVDKTELKQVSPDAPAKTHFVIVDCVGVTEGDLNDTQPLERKKSVPLKALLEHVAAGGTDLDVLSSLAARLARLDRICTPEERQAVRATGGQSLAVLAAGLVAAVDPDQQVARAREMFHLAPGAEPGVAQLKQAVAAITKQAAAPLANQPELRKKLLSLQQAQEQIVDELNMDELLADKTGFSKEATDRAMSTVVSFEQFLAEHKDEIDALKFFYSVPHRERLHFKDIKALAAAIQAPPRAWTPEKLWHAYAMLEKSKVKGASGQRLLTDIVSLVRFALHQEKELRPYPELVRERFATWMAQQANKGRKFTEPQVKWLEMMRDHVATSVEIEVDDFDSAPFVQEGGLGKAVALFGKELGKVIEELNEVLAA
jgi:type I restriction enzyme R subunit